jgi:GNAT superfamily N-acetyltransferase
LEPRLLVPEVPTDAHRAAILRLLSNYNRSHAEPGSGQLAILLLGDGDAVVGGLWGTILFQWLNVELLFVPSHIRGKAVGRRIILTAEASAAARGCIGACLDTHEFQAPGFYKKLGYNLVGTIQYCPPGSARHFFQKRLVGHAGAQLSVAQPDAPPI